MKSRSQRNDPPPDWVDGSWTVDCICGVNFDDGEEMVDCDECGVWVHTRCSRYVKGEKSFACDKCKSKNASNRNDSEETEVAQLLVELPMKTMSLEASYQFRESTTRGRPITLWKDVPLEEKVHVQGIPGGDPSLFSGLSSVFTPELWKCTGYVPKRFNFQYKEFPCWDNLDDINAERRRENENADDKGADALFSLSKEAAFAAPMTATFVGTRGRGEGGDYYRKVSSKESQRLKGEDSDARHEQSGIKNDRNMLRPIVFQSGKRKKEDLGTSRDRSGKKKSRVLHKEADAKRRAAPSCRTDRDPKFLKNDSRNIKNEVLMDTEPQQPVSDAVKEHNVDKPKDNLAADDTTSKAFSFDTIRQSSANGAYPKEDKSLARVDSSSKSDVELSSAAVDNDVGNAPIEEEVRNDKKEVKPPIEGTDSAALQVQDNHSRPDSTGGMSQSSVGPNMKMKLEVDNDSLKTDFNFQSSHADMKLDGTNDLDQHPWVSSGQMPENCSLSEEKVSSLQPKIGDVERSSKTLGECPTDTLDKLSSDHCQPMHLEGREGHKVRNKTSAEISNDLERVDEQPKVDGVVQNTPHVSDHGNMVGCVGKPSLSSTVVMDSGKPENNQNLTKQRVATDSNTNFKKDHNESAAVRDEERHRKSVKEKERKKSSTSSALVTSRLSKSSHVSVVKHISSDAKDPVVYTSKGSSVQNLAVTTGSSDSAASLQNQNTSHGHKKITSSGSSQRGEKFSQQNNLPSSKFNQAPSIHHHAHSSSAAALSDEELALLLHQELNSSPRVPRVPRVRQAGSSPQITSPTGSTSMLMKRASSFGGKEYTSGSRRKSKDSSKDGSHSSREIPPSPDPRIPDSMCKADGASGKEAEEDSPKSHSTDKKNFPRPYSRTANGGPSTSANGQSTSYTRGSPRNTSDEDTGIGGGPAHRTLPGLINEIMSKGRRMTYEELCNAVLPHWNSLRKHNGERYAYSSHSQAVLDCLRNRSEWAQLVDRGPKTNPSRKRRKLDPETAFESEDEKHPKSRNEEEEDDKNFESREEFPKGKRKARKRRHLALQDRQIKDVRKRQKEDELSDDEPFSSSSEDSTFGEDEIQGDVADSVGSETSASSDER